MPRQAKIDEDWVKKEIKKILKGRHKLHWDMPPAMMYGKSGRHDFIICQHSLHWTIEAKAGNNTPTDNQIDFANDTAAAGGISLCINEHTLNEVAYVADYIETHRKLPAGHNFEVYRKPI